MAALVKDNMRGLDVVRVAKNDLIEKLQQNREKHGAELTKAHEGWRKQVVETLAEALEQARAGEEYHTEFDLPEPTDRTKTYSETIDLLEASVDEELVLNRREFRELWLDEWAWKHEHIYSVSNYVG